METPNRFLNQPAFVLHTRSFSNSSLMVECFSAEMGRFPVIAKSVRTRRGGWSNLLQPFVPLLISWSGRGEVKTLSNCEVDGTGFALERKVLYCGLYINELLMRLLERVDPHPMLYTYYRQALQGLAAECDFESVLRRFELNLLEELGYGLALDSTADEGKPISPDLYYRYELECGLLLENQRSEGVIKGDTLLALRQGQPLIGSGQKEARLLMRRVLAHYLGGRPLRSRELFRVL